ncbi:MAG: phosphoglycerate kinase [Selenomonas sp.]|jgi:phosphoglycerate kinase|nr:phosphoglycerate kinase [Selenomonas sp.]MCI7331707.1 phosphoglycerate kinase [Selenomonadaceae bacterium]MDD6120215.1 phosphoglycerate kinase [Selenomonadaceae bacterium]MDD7056961.1 phosphoglycerate kinase [Selenomonadaceae bacterium]MDY3915228.1 phosphoglycerate kinase [Selenomonadaceae bacterium]
MAKKTLKDIDVKGKKVFVRVDYNVPFDENLNITNDTRMVRTLPTINYLLDNGAAVILACHIGRPTEAREDKFSTKHLVKHLSELLKKDVKWAADCVGPEAEKAAADLKPGEVLLLENLRYHKEEKKNDPEFAKQLASLADVAVDDAFGVSHRAHASNAGVPKYIETVAGFLMEKEINYIGNTLEHAQHPFVAIIGGAKVSDKIGVINNMIDKVDTIIIGGGMAHTFDAAKGLPIGESLCEPDKYDLARQLLKKAEDKGVKVVLPVDLVIADKFAADANTKTVPVDQVPDGWQALDSGVKTSEEYTKALAGAKTVIWNGPMGVFEFDAFAKGTLAVAKAVAKATEEGAVSIVGGGDSVAALKKTGLTDKISHVSTGGGATLEYLEGKEMPGIAALADK